MLGILLIPLGKWFSPSRGITIVRRVVEKLYYEIKVLFSSNSKIVAVIFRALFLFIVFNNIIGLLPYVFTATRHLATTLRIALPL